MRFDGEDILRSLLDRQGPLRPSNRMLNFFGCRVLSVHEARALLAEQVGKFTLERVSENGEVSFKANGQIDFFGERILRTWMVPGDRIATVVQGSSAYH